MRHLELHIIQSVPVSCLNRDDLNSPKTAMFGGVQRARVSSQSWKRAIREMAKEIASEKESNLFNGNRTRRMVFALKNQLVNRGIKDELSITIAETIADVVETLDSKVDEEGLKKIKTVMFFSDMEYEAIADAIVSSEDVQKSLNLLDEALAKIAAAIESGVKKDIESAVKEKTKVLKAMGKVLEKGSIAKAIKSAQLKDAADIALFGRMVANDPSLKVDGASMFSHALSIHKVDNEIDFFSAVDDLQPKSEAGAGMTSTLEFNSATYYRFAALNIDMLADSAHLGGMTKEERDVVVRTFIESVIKAIPGARKNSMNGNTLPNYVFGVVREKGHPIQLVNAFENPLRSTQGYTAKAVELLKNEYQKLKDAWDVQAVFADAIPEIGIKDFIDGMVEHVI